MSQIKIGVGETIALKCAVERLITERGFTEDNARKFLTELGADTLNTVITFNEVLALEKTKT